MKLYKERVGLYCINVGNCVYIVGFCGYSEILKCLPMGKFKRKVLVWFSFRSPSFPAKLLKWFFLLFEISAAMLVVIFCSFS